MLDNQLSRYGAISRSVPTTIGKTFFLVSATEAAFGDFQKTFPNDRDGQPRVFSTWATVIAAVQLTTVNSSIVVSPLFTTAPTLAQIASLDAAGCVVIQAGQNLPDGSYIATKAAAALATVTTLNLFQVNGRAYILSIIGQVETTIGATVDGAKFQLVPTVGSTTDMCATTNIASAAVGSQINITGTMSAALVVTTQGAVALASVGVPILVKAGTIVLNQVVTTTGNVSYKVNYIPIDPGAFISAL